MKRFLSYFSIFLSLIPLPALAEGSPAGLEEAARSVLLALKNKDGKALAVWVEEGRGLRFIPYPWDEIEKTLVLSPREVGDFFKSRSKKRWGTYDASGDPILLSPANYYRAFIWNVDYSRIQDRQSMALSEHLQKHYGYRGDNEDVRQAFPNGWTYTIFNPGVTAPEGGAMDWSWLTLVFVPKGEGWALAGIVHKEWTI